MQAKLETLLERLEGVSGRNGRWQARCPAHEDRSPSLAITESDDKILIHCFAGCSAADIMAAVGLQLGDLFAGSVSNGKSMGINWKQRALRARYAANLIAAYAGAIDDNWQDVAPLLGLDDHDQVIFWGAYNDLRRLLDGDH